MARRYGVKSALAGYIAKKLCPQLVIVPCNFRKYIKVSNVVMSVLSEYDPNLRTPSLDEAYMDLTKYMEERSEPGSSCNSTISRVRCSGPGAHPLHGQVHLPAATRHAERHAR